MHSTPEYNHHHNVFESNVLFIVQKKMKQPSETDHELVENVPGVEITQDVICRPCQ